MKITTIIVAGGSGSRMGSDTPKQFLLLGGMPVLMRTIMAVEQSVSNYVNNFIVVLPQSQLDYWAELCEKYNFTTPHKIAIGGATRFDSVKSGLSLVEYADIVMIQDGVRPFVTAQIAEQAIQTAIAHGAAIPVTEVVDSLRKVSADCSYIVNRAGYRAVQTPQVFQKELLVQSYEQPFDDSFTDDASVVEKAGHRVMLTQGSPQNIKITTKTDLEFANATYRQS